MKSRRAFSSSPLEVSARNEFDGAFAAMVHERANGVVVATDPVILGPPRSFFWRPNVADQFRRAAIYVDKILKGAKPADLPVETAHQVRAGDQRENRQGPRPDDPAVAAAAGGSGDRVSQRKPGRSQNPQDDAQLPLALSSKRRAGIEPEQAAKLAVARRARPSALSGHVKLALTIDMPRALAERLTARAIREGKNLEALVAEILGSAEK